MKQYICTENSNIMIIATHSHRFPVHIHECTHTHTTTITNVLQCINCARLQTVSLEHSCRVLQLHLSHTRAHLLPHTLPTKGGVVWATQIASLGLPVQGWLAGWESVSTCAGWGGRSPPGDGEAGRLLLCCHGDGTLETDWGRPGNPNETNHNKKL